MAERWTPGPWRYIAVEGGWDGVAEAGGQVICKLALNEPANALLIAAAPELYKVALNAAATIGAIYDWLERVEKAGGAVSIEGVATCHAMMKSLRKNAKRTEQLVLSPLRDAITKARGEP